MIRLVLDSALQSFLLEEAGLGSIFVFFYVFVKIRHTADDAPKFGFTFATITAFTLAIPVLQYASARPYQPVSIVASIIAVAAIFPLYGIIRKYFATLQVTISASRYSFYSFFGFLFTYLILFIVTVDGIDYFFVGIISPENIILTPEFISIGVPTLVFLVLFTYRVGLRFKSSPFRFMREISSDLITLSLTVLLFSFVATVSGAELTRIPIEANFDSTEIGLAAGVITVGIEYVLVFFQKEMQGIRPNLSIDDMVDQFMKPFTSPDKNPQRTLDEFEEPKVASRPKPGFWATLDAKHSIEFRKRRLKPTLVLTVCLLLASSLLIYAEVAPVQTVLLVQGVEVHTNIVEQSMLGNATDTTSEGMQSATTGHSYAVPIVNITAFNATFIAPLSDRYGALNSSTYTVRDTGEYLLVELDHIVINGTFATNLLARPAHNQTSNSEFNYIGIFGDAEIYYSLAFLGYHNVTVLSEVTTTGTNIPVTKIMFANNSNGDAVLIGFQDSGDIFSLQTLTITTTNVQLYNNIEFLFLQAKIPITPTLIDVNPKPGFRVT